LVAQQHELNNVGVVLIARQTSSRLPNKVLLEINGKKLLEIMLDKVLSNTKDYIFAIPDNRDNRVLRDFLEDNGYHYFAGSEQDVLGRFIEASEELSSKYIQRLNCDNLLFDPSYMRHCYKSLNDESDVYTNVNSPNHSGSSVEIILKEKCVITRKPTDYESEHVFPYFYANKNLSIVRIEGPKKTVFPIDTKSDFEKAMIFFT
jgi:spore coat polysaccharide biosynthesis protein SpsF